MGRWTFGRKLALGFGAAVAFTLLVCGISLYLLDAVVSHKDHVIKVNARLLAEAERLYTIAREKATAARGYLLTRDDSFVERLAKADTNFDAAVVRATPLIQSPRGRELLATIRELETTHQLALERNLDLRRQGVPLERVVEEYESIVKVRRGELDRAIEEFITYERNRLQEADEEASGLATVARWVLLALVLAAVLMAIVMDVLLTRWVARRVTTAVKQVEGSAADLEATAAEQATGTKEQAAAMSQIDTTLREIVASAQQQAENARRVALVAGDTAAAAAAGDETLRAALEGTVSVREQIEGVVQHMLELERKSQQIGGILDIINEYAEQTNILAINASIEAAGASEAGRRFGVVAEEIRRLADRMGSSAKQIRGLIDDIRASVASTVMATETSSKAVASSKRRSDEVASAFGRIATLVSHTTDAAREIELSTRQQVTAMEDVHTAVGSVVQVTQEAEIATRQTLHTAAGLVRLSGELAQIVSASNGATSPTAG